MYAGVDTGGTFVDFVIQTDDTVYLLKRMTNRERPYLTLLRTLKEMDFPRMAFLYHGTTLATNAYLERKGGRVVLITTHGFEDIIEIGRQNRTELYALHYRKPEPLIPPEHRIGVRERILSDGTIHTFLSPAEIQKVRVLAEAHNPDVVAICLLFSYENPSHEQALAQHFRDWGFKVFVSSELHPQYREYERTIVTVLHAYLHPVLSAYANRLAHDYPNLFIMTSIGGLSPWKEVLERPASTLLSGPVAGVFAAYEYGKLMGYKRLITLDMGGTSTDVSLIDGEPLFVQETTLGGLPIQLPMIHIETIGAGGGSIVQIDPAGALKVGPESAGGNPGPVCYGKGGTKITLTDAHVVAGTIPSQCQLGGEYPIYPEPAKEAFERLAHTISLPVEDTIHALFDVTIAHMERAIRVVSLQKGYNPEDFALFVFGGAGGLHACHLAENLGISTVLFPRGAGVLSALGCLLARPSIVRVRSVMKKLSELSTRALKELTTTVLEGVPYPIKTQQWIEHIFLMRYEGQSHEILVPYHGSLIKLKTDFEKRHKALYGFIHSRSEIECVSMIVRVYLSDHTRTDISLAELLERMPSDVPTTHLGPTRYPWLTRYDVKQGEEVKGPLLFLDNSSTFFLKQGWGARVDTFYNIIARKKR